MFTTIKNLKKINAVIKAIEEHKGLITKVTDWIDSLRTRVANLTNQVRDIKEEINILKGKLSK